MGNAALTWCAIPGTSRCWTGGVDELERRRALEVRAGESIMSTVGIAGEDIHRYTIKPVARLDPRDAHRNPFAMDDDDGDAPGKSASCTEPRAVTMQIAQTFPEDTERYGVLVVAVISSPKSAGQAAAPPPLAAEPADPYVVVPCRGRSYRDVSRDVNRLVKRAHAAGLKSVVCFIYNAPSSADGRASTRTTASTRLTHVAYGRDQSSACGMGRQIFFVAPTEDRQDSAVRNVVVAWAISVSGVSHEVMRHIPVVWRKTSFASGFRVGIGGPAYRPRRAGGKDSSDRSEQPTDPDAVQDPEYDPLGSAPLPKDGHMTVPSRSFPRGRAAEEEQSIRAVRTVDVHLFHPMISEWVKNCAIRVSEIGPNGLDVTPRLDTMPRNVGGVRAPPDPQTRLLEAVPVDVTATEPSQDSEPSCARTLPRTRRPAVGYHQQRRHLQTFISPARERRRRGCSPRPRADSLVAVSRRDLEAMFRQFLDKENMQIVPKRPPVETKDVLRLLSDHDKEGEQ